MSLNHLKLTQTHSHQDRRETGTLQTDMTSKDDELEKLKEKMMNSYKLYNDCLRIDSEVNLKDKTLRLSNHRSLYDLSPDLQEKVRGIMLKKLQKNSFIKELDLYPVKLYDNIKKKLGIRAYTKEFPEKICKYFKKKALILGEEQNFLFKKANKLHKQAVDNDTFSQLQLKLETYERKLGKKKALYVEMAARMSQSFGENNSEIPEVEMQKNEKFLFANKQQPPAHSSIKTLDYKFYLNDKIRQYKMTRTLRKFKEVVKHFPTGLMSKLLPAKPVILERGLNTSKTFNSYIDSVLLDSEKSKNRVKAPDRFADYKNITDFEVLKERLVKLSRTFGLKQDINVDNGALLLFSVEGYFKELYPIQQKQITWLIDDEEEEEDEDDESMIPEKEKPYKTAYFPPKGKRSRYLKQTPWVTEVRDYDEGSSVGKKMEKPIYEDRFDSHLKTCFEFVQLSSMKESAMKIEFRITRAIELFKEKKVEQVPMFFEFLKAYVKLLILKSRNNIIKLYDSLNFFRSAERTIFIKKQEIHVPSKAEFADAVTKTLRTLNKSRIIEDRRRRTNADLDSGTGSSGKEKIFSHKVIKQLQDDDVVFGYNIIDISNIDQKSIMYDIVNKDFAEATGRMLQTGAHFIDMHKQSAVKEGTFDMLMNDLDREALVADLLELEAQYHYSKAKYVNHLLEILKNSFSFKDSMNIMKYMQDVIAKRPQFAYFDQSLVVSYTEESKSFDCLEELAASFIQYQKVHESNLDEFQSQIFTEEEIKDTDIPPDDLPKLSFVPTTPKAHQQTMMQKRKSSTRENTVDTNTLKNEFFYVKPYESLVAVFYGLKEVENAAENLISNSFVEDDKLAWNFKARGLVLEEASKIWKQLKYDLAALPAMRDFDKLECDPLFDISNPAARVHNFFFKEATIPNTPKTSMPATPKLQQQLTAGTPRLMTPSKTSNAAGSLLKSVVEGRVLQKEKTSSSNEVGAQSVKKQARELTEEEYLLNFLEFIRLKETMLTSLLSSAYQAQVYLGQIQLFQREGIYKELRHKTGDLQTNFFKWLLNLESLSHVFDMKVMEDTKQIVFDVSKLEDMWISTEYVLFYEAILQNALQMNHFYILDVAQSFSQDPDEFNRVLISPQSVFYNIVEKRTSWYLAAKVNPLLQMVLKGMKQEKAEAVVENHLQNRQEPIIEFLRVAKRFMYHDALKVQAIGVTRMLRKIILKFGFDTDEVFIVRDLYDEQKKEDLSDIFSDDNDSPTRKSSPGSPARTPKKSKRNSQIEETNSKKKVEPRVQETELEDCFDDGGKWLDPFVVPASQDILKTELEQNLQVSIEGDPQREDAIEDGKDRKERNKTGGHSIAHKIGKILQEEEVVVKKSKKRRQKKTEWLEGREELAYLENCCMLHILEWSHNLLQILTYETLEVTLKGNPFDVLVLYEGSPKDRQRFRRNYMRVEDYALESLVWLKKFKKEIMILLKGLKPGQTREVAKDLVQQALKRRYQMTLLACTQYMRDCRMQGDLEPLKILRRYIISLAFNTMNYLYDFNEKMYFQKYFVNQQKINNPITQVIDFESSESLKMMDFVFINPMLPEKYDVTIDYQNFTRCYKSSQEELLKHLFSLKKSSKAEISTNLANISLKAEQFMFHRDVMPDDNMLIYFRETSKIFKKNLKALLMQEVLLSIKEKALPFSNIRSETLLETHESIQYHYSRAYSETFPGLMIEGDFQAFQTDTNKVNLLASTIGTEIEKVLVKEVLEFYKNNIEKKKMREYSLGGIGTLNTVSSYEKTNKERIFEEMDRKRFLPFFYGFTSKVLNRSLFINSSNMDECIVIPVVDLEDQLNELNNGVLEYFEGLEYEIQRRYLGRITVLKSRLEDMTKNYRNSRNELEHVKIEHERVLNARVVETSSKILFQVDTLKKKIQEMNEEYQLNLKEAKEKIEQQFKDKLVEDELTIKRLKKRFYELREGLAFDLTGFIEREKGSTIKSIFEKKNQIFAATGVPETTNVGVDLQKEIDEARNRDPDEGELIAKLYKMLKQTRTLYQFREITVKEKCEKQLAEMRDRLADHQDLLKKLNDLQTAERNIQNGYTDAKKELAVSERHNSILRKNLHKGSNEMIRLQKKSNANQLDYSDLQVRYEESMRRKFIYVPADDPPVANSGSQNKLFMKVHQDGISGILTHRSSANGGGMAADQSENQRNSTRILKPDLIDLSQRRTPSASKSRSFARPMTSSGAMTPRMVLDVGVLNIGEELKRQKEMLKTDRAHKRTVSIEEASSYVVKKGNNSRSGSKGKSHGGSAEKGFLMKKFVSGGGSLLP